MAYPLLIDMAIHQFDLSRDLIGADPVAVYCESFNPAWSWYAGDAAAQVVFEFASRRPVRLPGSWCSPGLETSWNGSWRVSGAGGTRPLGRRQRAGGREPGRAAGWRPTSRPGPEQIAGSLAEFVAARPHRCRFRPARRTATCSAWPWSRRRSGPPRTYAGSSIAEILADAYADALAAEEDADVRTVLAGWASVHDAVGAAAATRLPNRR